MKVKGYFTIESNIRGLTSSEIEQKLGFRKGRLSSGARIFVLMREPSPAEFEPAGSTFFPHRNGLNINDLTKTKFRPGAWFGERLVKVEPVLPHSAAESYPAARKSPAEQWILTVDLPAYIVCTLKDGETYRH